MLINLRKHIEDVSNENIYSFQFDIPDVRFSVNQYVHVNEICLNWSDQRGSEKYFNGRLDSSLVDKSPINPYQQLLYFQHIQDSNLMLFTPTHLQKYKIQRTSLQSAEFKLTLSRRVKLEDFCLQLEITDGPSRLQQIR